MDKVETNLLNEVLNHGSIEQADAYNIRANGHLQKRKENPYIHIRSKEDGSGIDIEVLADTLFGIIDIPVIITESGLTDIVYNDFYIGKNANVTIVAGCGIHNHAEKQSQHNGIHRFFLEENAKVRYIERHYAEGKGKGKKVLNPTTEISMKKGSYLMMDTIQLKGVDESIRITKANVEDGATLVINEKILTSNHQTATTDFQVTLGGGNASCHVVSRSVAKDDSCQEFSSNIIGKDLCYGHVECDAIIQENGRVKAIPEIDAQSVDANLIHEAAIGKIAGSQLVKLMSLGLSEKEAENAIISGFLK